MQRLNTMLWNDHLSKERVKLFILLVFFFFLAYRPDIDFCFMKHDRKNQNIDKEQNIPWLRVVNLFKVFGKNVHR